MEIKPIEKDKVLKILSVPGLDDSTLKRVCVEVVRLWAENEMLRKKLAEKECPQP